VTQRSDYDIVKGILAGNREACVDFVRQFHAPIYRLLVHWPTPIVFSGYEIGMAIPFPAECIERDFAYVAHHPLAEAYVLYKSPPHNRPSWDLTSVLYAVRPNYGYFDLSLPGRVHVASDGATSFEPQNAGPHRYLILKSQQQIRVREALAQLASQPPIFTGACR
jgi:purine nucleosidase